MTTTISSTKPQDGDPPAHIDVLLATGLARPLSYRMADAARARPGQLVEVIGQFTDLGGEYQVELTRDDRSLDHLALTVERGQGQTAGNDAALAHELETRLHKAIMARVSVNVADYASLPRTFSKSKRVVDKR